MALVRPSREAAIEDVLKRLCHNVVVVNQAIIKLGIAGTFWQEWERSGRRRKAPGDVLPLTRQG